MYVHLENIQFVLRILVQHMYDVVVRNGTEHNGLFLISLFRKIQGVFWKERDEGRKMNGRTDLWGVGKKKKMCGWCYTWKLFLVFLALLTRTSFPFSLKLTHSPAFIPSNIQFMLEWPSDVYIHRYILLWYFVYCIIFSAVLYFCCLFPSPFTIFHI